ncbi:MAG: MgtC/SapB family protein [Megasphaera sp.]|jgi:putative Mg2+ transporter-C (MgtC) family protein|nr:MgtC/SapB family protein [Megasphaera sp.]MCH4188177.1 MgtC/SapB family protein [Megasphaera sp.]MCH4217921.1 MgtC/SapB family protein [Megasphaera sp.]
MMISTTDSIIRLCIALILGGVIGYERQAQSKAAGLRTHTLVCVGACLCMIISINIAMDYYFMYGYANSDPERIAAQVVSGVGFLGAGTILANQKERNVQGLTTAASLWAVAAIGLVVGAGYMWIAVAATVMIFIVLRVFVRLDAFMQNHYRKQYTVHLFMKNTVGQSRRLNELLSRHHLRMDSFESLSDEESDEAELYMTVSSPHYLSDTDILTHLLALRGVRMAEMKEPVVVKDDQPTVS